MSGRAARLLARGWSTDARKWTWATTAVLAGTLAVLLGTSGLLDGTSQRTLAQVSDFYTGDLRITPVAPGAVPAGWFHLDDGADGTPGALGQLQAAGASASARVEGQYVLSRRTFAEAAQTETAGVPVDVPGSQGDATKAVSLGALVGVLQDDPSRPALESHLLAGRLPRPSASANDTVEVAMSALRLERLLTPDERAIAGSPPRLDVANQLDFDLTSAQLDPASSGRTLLHRHARIVGLFATGVDLLDGLTLVAPAEEVRWLLGQPRDAPVANVLLVHTGTGPAQGVADRNGWATQGTAAFADAFVGQMVAVLRGAAWLVSALLFVLPAALIGHGLARQLANQQRELAVCTAIGVPRRTLGNALALQVLRITLWAAVAAAAATLALWLTAPALLPLLPSPLPLAFTVTWGSVAVAAAVLAVAVGVGLAVGIRSRRRMPLTAALRSA